MHYSDTDFNHKKILITGGAGFIGSNLAFIFKNTILSLILLFLIFLEMKRPFPMAISKALVTLKTS